MQKITTFLWFDDQAEKAADFYTSIFADSRIESVTRYSEAGPGKPGSVMIVTFNLHGQEYMALNGGPHFKFTPAISLFVTCETQAEVDELWAKLSAGGEEGQCGWLTDKFGLSWQIVPAALDRLMQSGNSEQSKWVMQAMLQMMKLDITGLQRAYDQG